VAVTQSKTMPGMHKVIETSPRSYPTIIRTNGQTTFTSKVNDGKKKELVQRVSVDCRFSSASRVLENTETMGINDQFSSSNKNHSSSLIKKHSDILVLDEAGVPLYQNMDTFQQFICTQQLRIFDPNLRIKLLVNPNQPGISDVPDTALEGGKEEEKEKQEKQEKIIASAVIRPDGLRVVETITEFNRLVLSFQKHISGIRNNVLDNIFSNIFNELNCSDNPNRKRKRIFS
jgi:hypothetical protein